MMQSLEVAYEEKVSLVKVDYFKQFVVQRMLQREALIVEELLLVLFVEIFLLVSWYFLVQFTAQKSWSLNLLLAFMFWLLL